MLIEARPESVAVDLARAAVLAVNEALARQAQLV
jgi:hypothetical protein